MVVQLIIEVFAALAFFILAWEFFVVACQIIVTPFWLMYKFIKLIFPQNKKD